LVARSRKRERLEQQGALNRHPDRVRALHFQPDSFFDPADLVQVKYEMLRQVIHEGASKAEAAALYGMSRPTFYQAEAAFARAGLAGLLPRQRGPKGAHKLTAPVMAFIEEQRALDPSLHARALARAVKTEFGLSVHPRSIERALTRKKKP
jgi:transposase